jgi:hypothetical protein
VGGAPRLAQAQLRSLERLRTVSRHHGLYLAGGGALAHHLGHRRSLDLDLFGPADLDLDVLRDELVATRSDVSVLSSTDATLRVFAGGVPIDFVRYRYPLLQPPVAGPGGHPTASIVDIAAMKLAAIARRGLMRDFWDLYAICATGIALGQCAHWYLQKFGRASSDLYHVARSLVYFADAEGGVRPLGMTGKRWSEIKRFFEREAPRLLD